MESVAREFDSPRVHFVSRWHDHRERLTPMTMYSGDEFYGDDITSGPIDTDHEPQLIWIDCERCHGTGGPAPIFDEDTGRWVTYVCSACSGRGELRVWSDRE
jgi:hypothetical protein